MGGCRCSFRQCHVTTAKCPRMHFFRFPIKEPERLRKWIQYSQMEQMAQYTQTRKRNTVVCARHFRIECFMNYKMDKLAPNAVPTLMRLSKDKALDFELNIEKGVLVTLEVTKLKHLIPPDDFECPLYLENDKILMYSLYHLKDQPRDFTTVEETVQYKEFGDKGQQFKIEKPMKSSSNAVEILETIQFSAPFKRTRECSTDEIEPSVVDGMNIKRYKILNSAHCSMFKGNKNETTLVITSRPEQINTNHLNCENIEFVDSNNVQKQYADTNASGESNDEDLELFQIHKDDDESVYDLETFDSDLTIAQLKTDNQSLTDSLREQLVTAQYEILELKKQIGEIESLRLKIHLLEKENSQLRQSCKETKELRRNLLHFEAKNNHMKNILNEQKDLKETIAKYINENKTLKEENKGIALLKAEWLSRVQETEELKEMIEHLKNTKSNDSEERLKNAHQEYTAKENKLKEEISSLQKEAEIKEKNLLFAKSQLLKIEADFNSLKSEKDSLQQKYCDLEEKYLKLHALQNQEPTVSTSLENSTVKTETAPTISTVSLTKAQLFNGIKRYLSSAMVSLLRMEMFGSSEREWKTDERQVAVDILRLGENVYKYFTDEWRFRLPALRDVHNWLSKSVQMYDEEDL